MQRLAPQWLGGCKLRDIWFQPTFHKHVGELSSGVHIHADGPWYDDDAFQPWRVQALGFKAIRSRSEEHTSELQSLMRISYAVFCLKKKKYLMKQASHYP